MSQNHNHTIAIDFGTARTKAAYFNPKYGRAERIQLSEDGRDYWPSVFCLRADGNHLYGDAAVDQLETEPGGFFFEPLKRSLRESTVKGENRRLRATPESLLTLLFSGVREKSMEVVAFQSVPPSGATLTVPALALFGEPERNVLRAAAVAAGFTESEISFVEEPVAAARSWVTENNAPPDRIVVFDCGGGTIDWACLRRSNNKAYETVPELPAGSAKVGGFDVDRELLEIVLDQIDDDALRDVLEDHRGALLDALRRGKERFSSNGKLGTIRVCGRRIKLDGMQVAQVIEARFVDQALSSLRPYLQQVRKALGEDRVNILLVGGSSRFPTLAKRLEDEEGCGILRWERSAFATVLGAVPMPVPPRSSADITATQNSDADSARIGIAKRVGVALSPVDRRRLARYLADRRRLHAALPGFFVFGLFAELYDNDPLRGLLPCDEAYDLTPEAILEALGTAGRCEIVDIAFDVTTSFSEVASNLATPILTAYPNTIMPKQPSLPSGDWVAGVAMDVADVTNVYQTKRRNDLLAVCEEFAEERARSRSVKSVLTKGLVWAAYPVFLPTFVDPEYSDESFRKATLRYGIAEWPLGEYAARVRKQWDSAYNSLEDLYWSLFESGVQLEELEDRDWSQLCVQGGAPISSESHDFCIDLVRRLKSSSANGLSHLTKDQRRNYQPTPAAIEGIINGLQWCGVNISDAGFRTK